MAVSSTSRPCRWTSAQRWLAPFRPAPRTGDAVTEPLGRRALLAYRVVIGATLVASALAGCGEAGDLTHIKTSKERGVTIRAEAYDTGRRLVWVSYGNLREADLEALREAAEDGDGEALMALATLYWFGGGLQVRGEPVFAPDKAKAVDYYRRAAEKGHVPAQVFLAHALATGDGVAPDQAAALPWLKQSAEAGNARSQLLFAEFLEHGKGGVARDPGKAAEFYRKAAEADQPRAHCALARLHSAGTGVEQNPSESVKWYRKCAAGGDVSAMSALATAYETGQGVEQDAAAAVEWFRKAAEKGDVAAMLRLAKAFQTGTGVPENRAASVRWYLKAAEAGDSRAYYPVAFAYDRGHAGRRNPKEAARFMMMALKAKDPQARERMIAGAYDWTRNFRRELQRLLQKEGVYKGRIDGVFGKSARRAIEEFVQ